MGNFCVKLNSGERELEFGSYLFRLFTKSDLIAEKIAEKLDIQADSKAEAVDFVKSALIDIAAEDLGINPDENTYVRFGDNNTYRDRFYK